MYVTFTIDCESPLDEIHFENSVFAEISGKDYGVGLISDTLQKAGFRGSFFVDTCAEDLFGEEIVLKTARLLSQKNQDVQIHAHPQKGEFCQISDNGKRRIIDRGCNLIFKATGKLPTAFRAGSYMMDEESFPLLKEYDIIADCSNFSGVSPLAVTNNSVKRVGEIYEIPVSYYRLFFSPLISLYNNIAGKKAFYGGNCKIDINWMNINGMKRVCKKFLSSGISVMVIFLHSFSFIDWGKMNRYGKDERIIRRDIIRRFEDFVTFLQSEENVQVVTMRELTDLLINDADERQNILSAPDCIPVDFWGIDTMQLFSSVFSS